MNPVSLSNLIRGDARPLSDDERAAIVSSYNAGAKLREIAASISRPLGTIRTATFNLRAAGLIGYRYNTVFPDGF